MSDAVFVRCGLVVEKSFGGYQESRGTDAALQRGFFEECLLQRVQAVRCGHSFDGLDGLAVDLGAEHQAGVDDAPIERDGARPSVAVQASFFGAGQSYDLAQRVEEAHVRRHEKFVRAAVNRGTNVYPGWSRSYLSSHLPLTSCSLYSFIDHSSGQHSR